MFDTVSQVQANSEIANSKPIQIHFYGGESELVCMQPNWTCLPSYDPVHDDIKVISNRFLFIRQIRLKGEICYCLSND